MFRLTLLCLGFLSGCNGLLTDFDGGCPHPDGGSDQASDAGDTSDGGGIVLACAPPQVLCAGNCVDSTNLPPSCVAQWNRIETTDRPSFGLSSAMVFDPIRQEVLLHSGSQTWGYSESSWKKKTTTLYPIIEDSAQRGFEEKRGTVFLFGDPFDSASTWEWNGTEWIRRSDGPAIRDLFAMAYDSKRGRAVVFGGKRDSNTLLNDTWEWDGQDWQEMKPATVPEKRYGHSMAYDGTRQAIVMFGGELQDKRVNETWEWNGTNWTLLQPQRSPRARRVASMAYDGVRQRVILFAGYSSGYKPESDLWEWDGLNWIQLTPPGAPPIRVQALLTYDKPRKRFILFSGYDETDTLSPTALDDTWELIFP